MKKLFLALMLAAGIAAAHAETSVTVGNNVVRADGTNIQSHRYAFSVRHTLAPGFVGDISTTTTTADVSNALGVRAEVGVTSSIYSIDRFSFNVRTAVGEKLKSGTESTSFYVIEPGVGIKVTDTVSARVAYRYRDAFSSGVADQSNTMRYSVAYAVTKQDKIGLGFDQVRGNGAEKSVGVSYTRSF